MDNRLLKGAIATLAGGIFWGFSGSCVQYLGANYTFPPLLLTTVRMLGAGLLFLIVLLTRRRNILRAIARDRASLRQLAIFGCIGLLSCQFTYIVAVNFTNAGTTTVLASFGIVICMVVTCLLRRRWPNAAETGGVVCAVLATVLIATGGDLTTMSIPFWGLVFGLLNAVSMAFYTMYPRHLFEKWGSLATTGLGMLIGGLGAALLWCASAATGIGLDPTQPVWPSLDATGYAVVALIVVVGTFCSFGLFLHGVSIMGSVRGTQLGAIEPVSATIFAALWLGTAFTWADWIGLVLMVATVLLVSKQ